MNPNFRRIALIAAAFGLLVSLFVALSRNGDDDEAATPATTTATTARTTGTAPSATTTTAQPKVITIRIVIPAANLPKARKYTVRRDRKIKLVVDSQIADQVHLHGYNLSKGVSAGQPATIEFTADAPGRFEIELENHGIRIGELEVRP